MKKIMLIVTSGLLCISAWSQMLSTTEFLGYDLGTRFTRHHRVVDYITHVANETPHFKLHEYGRTSEDRPLLALVMSSVSNMEGLDQIIADNTRRVSEGIDGGARIPIVYLSYNVHGNEAVCTEAAMRTIEALVNEHSDLLNDVIVIIDPCVNPDGRDRYVQFQDRTSGPVPNTSWESWEHKEPWPGGRSNHYMFDLNRDLAWQTQIETQARTTFYRKWMPHVHVDYHEQGMNSPYYFAPAAEPLHQVITPWQRKCQEHIGGFNARAFDARGALYFTREIFDLFYPSYGDTWPMFHGAIGMTYEQGGSGSAGRAILTEIGDTLTLAYRIENHHATAIATISAAVHHKDKLLKEFSAYHRRNREEPWGDYAAYLIPAEGNDEGKMVWLTDLLDKHGITYSTPQNTRKSLPALDYSTLKPTTVKPVQGDLLIDSHQPNSALLGVLFDPDPVLSDSLTYDITTWALPFAYGLQCYGLTSRIQSGDTFEFATKSVAKKIESPYAWVIDYKTDEGTTLLAQLLKNGVVVRVADSPFTSEGIDFDRGTLVITKRNNEALLDEIASMLEAGDRDIAGLRVTEVRSGLSEAGPDLGSEHFHYLKAPRVAVFSGESVSSLSFGEVWHKFEQIYKYPVTVTKGMNRMDLDNFDVVVMPRGWYSLNENQMNELSSWVNDGGQLIAIGGACRTFADKEGWGLSRKGDDIDEGMREDEYDAHSKSDRFAPFALDTRMSIMDDIPGAVYKIGLDNTHPLAYGYGNHYLSIKTSAQRYAPLNNGGNVGVLSGSAEPFSGFSGARANRALDNSLSFGAHSMGGGNAIYLVDNVLFRAFWKNGHQIFGNAVFFGPAM